MDEEIMLWCLGTGEEATDYVLNEWDGDLLPKLYDQDEIRFEFNQQNQSWSRVSCTIFSAVWAVCDLMNYDISLDELKEVDETSYLPEWWRIRWQWWYTKRAVELAKTWWNTKHGDLWKIAYYRVSKYSDLVDEILQKWYTMVTNLCPTSEYWMDYRKDAILDWYDFWRNSNGHAIDIIWNEWKRSTKDSYKGRKTADWKKDCNRYELKHKISELTNYSPSLYVFTKVSEDNMERIKQLNEFKALLTATIENNSKMRHLTNDEWYKNKLHEMNESNRSKLKDINEELKKLS